jgi:probable rRNA maturation factor
MVINRQRAVRVSTLRLEKFLARVRRKLRLNGSECTVCLVTNNEMARMNKSFRGKSGPTDVLSFPTQSVNNERRAMRRQKGHASPGTTYSTFFTSSTSYVGDIAIAPLIARRNAARFGRTLNEELSILILHGVLHLMGYDHETDSGQMERREMQLRRRLKLEPARPTKARN